MSRATAATPSSPPPAASALLPVLTATVLRCTCSNCYKNIVKEYAVLYQHHRLEERGGLRSVAREGGVIVQPEHRGWFQQRKLGNVMDDVRNSSVGRRKRVHAQGITIYQSQICMTYCTSGHNAASGFRAAGVYTSARRALRSNRSWSSVTRPP
jgi:hypothetical protein